MADATVSVQLLRFSLMRPGPWRGFAPRRRHQLGRSATACIISAKYADAPRIEIGASRTAGTINALVVSYFNSRWRFRRLVIGPPPGAPSAKPADTINGASRRRQLRNPQ